MTVADARDVTQTSRKVILPLLEELDRRHLTKRMEIIGCYANDRFEKLFYGGRIYTMATHPAVCDAMVLTAIVSVG